MKKLVELKNNQKQINLNDVQNQCKGKKLWTLCKDFDLIFGLELNAAGMSEHEYFIMELLLYSQS